MTTASMNTTMALVNVSNIYGPNYMSKMASLINVASIAEVEAIKTSVKDMIIYYNDIIHTDEVITNTSRWSSVMLAANNESAIKYIDDTFMKYYGYHFWDINNIEWTNKPGESHGSASLYIESCKMFWDLGLVHQSHALNCANIKHAIDETEIDRVIESLR